MKKTKGSLASRKKTEYAGTHVIAEFWGGKIIENPKKIREFLVKAAKVSKNIPLGVKIHKFKPQGITGFILLAESHISIHTWPEMNYIAIDIFSCGIHTEPLKGLDYLKKVFQPKKIKIKTLKRG